MTDDSLSFFSRNRNVLPAWNASGVRSRAGTIESSVLQLWSVLPLVEHTDVYANKLAGLSYSKPFFKRLHD